MGSCPSRYKTAGGNPSHLLFRSQCASNGQPTANCTCYGQPSAIGPEALQGELLATQRRACLAGSLGSSSGGGVKRNRTLRGRRSNINKAEHHNCMPHRYACSSERVPQAPSQCNLRSSDISSFHPPSRCRLQPTPILNHCFLFQHQRCFA